MKGIILKFLCLTFCISTAYAQKISISCRALDNNEIELTTTLTNNSEQFLSFYKPKIKDFCNGIVVMKFYLTKGDTLDYFCKELTQIDEIQIRCDNTISLGNGEVFSTKYILSLPQEVLIDVKKIFFQVNFKDFEFSGNASYKLFKGILKTEQAIIK
jgi:hypothetical protein